MVAFQYGSIVFFNFGDDEEEEALSAVRKFCTDKFRETRKDGTNFFMALRVIQMVRNCSPFIASNAVRVETFIYSCCITVNSAHLSNL
jgi:uncharacterized Rmd1/YagE family protein